MEYVLIVVLGIAVLYFWFKKGEVGIAVDELGSYLPRGKISYLLLR